VVAVNALLVALLLISLVMAVLLLLSVSVGYRARLRTPAARRSLGTGQLLAGALWILWGVLYLRQHGLHAIGGWYAVVLGVLWCQQAIRRLA